tara:strand:- start:30126 stop:30539 length:414 start_codon:yes stop_codon:yes gene_type:complete
MKQNKAVKEILINQLMLNGKKHKSEIILFNNLKTIQKTSKKKLHDVLKLSVVNSSPYFSIKKIQRKKKKSMEFPFLLNNATKILHGVKQIVLNSRHGKLDTELLNSSRYLGATISHKTELHRESFFKKKMSSYRWFC